MKSEPLVTVATITTLAAAVLGLLVAFGLDLSSERQSAILGIAAVAAPLVVAAFARGKVTPVDVQPPSERGAVDVVQALLVVFLAVVILVVLFRLLG